FTVGGMHPAGRAELSQFETLSIVPFVFRGRVVAVLAVRTSQRHNNTILFAFSSHVFLHSGFGCIVSNPGPRTIPFSHGRGKPRSLDKSGTYMRRLGKPTHSCHGSGIPCGCHAPLPLPNCRPAYTPLLLPCGPLRGWQNAPLLPSPPAGSTPPSSRCCPPASPSPLPRAT